MPNPPLMTRSEEPDEKRAVWSPDELERFVRRARNTSWKPPSLEQLRRSGKFVESPIRIPLVPSALGTPPGDETAAGADENARSAGRTRDGIALTPEITGHTALGAFLTETAIDALHPVLAAEGIAFEPSPDLASALAVIANRPPAFLFLGFHFAPLHAPSLIAALKACPFHRSMPIVVVTPSDPRLLDLSLYRPDAVVGETASLTESVAAFLDQVRLPQRSPAPGGSPWVRLAGRALLVESSSMAHRILGKLLHVAGVEVAVVETSSEAMLATAERDFDIVILDLEMPSGDPADLIRFLRAAQPTAPLVGLSSVTTDPRVAGVDAVLHKPVRCAHFVSLWSRLLSRPALPQRLAR